MKRNRIDAAWQGMADCRGCGIRELALFADLAEDDFGLIHMPIDEITYATGAVLYHADDPATSVFTVRSGLVKLVQYLPDGSQRIVRLVRPGGTLGLEALVDGDYAHTAIALKPVLLCRIPVQVITRLSTETPRLHRQLMQRWARAVADADSWLTQLSTGSARARIARLCLTLAEDANADGFELFPREDLGAMLGITTETASRVVAEYRRSGALMELGDGRFTADVTKLDALSDAG